MPDKAVLVLTGGTLNLLDADELCAVAGHELAHHVLWTAEGGRYLAAARLLDAAESDARTPSEYLETARRFRLATELYADRGAVLACGSLIDDGQRPGQGGHGADQGRLRGVPAAGGRGRLQRAERRHDAPGDGAARVGAAGVERARRGGRSRGRWRRSARSSTSAALDVLGQERLAEVTRSLVWLLVADDVVRSDEALALAERLRRARRHPGARPHRHARRPARPRPAPTSRRCCSTSARPTTRAVDDLGRCSRWPAASVWRRPAGS